MPDAAPPVAPSANVKSWDLDVILPALAKPVRWRLLSAIARGGPKSATALEGTADRRLDATLKHLVILCEAGLLATQPDERDGRRQLYSLAPSLPVEKTERGPVVDLGFCVLRL